jgi:phage tail-like protein
MIVMEVNKMGNKEIKFLVINSPTLWKHYQWNSFQEKGSGKKTVVTDLGLTLGSLETYLYKNSFVTDYHRPNSLAVDECGQLYALQTRGFKTGTDAELFCYPLKQERSEQVGCLSFRDASSLAVTERDYFVMLDDKLLCLGRTNSQIRWQQDLAPLTGTTLKITARSQYRFYMLDTASKKIFTELWDWQPGTEIEILLTKKDDENNEIPYLLDNPVDIASDSQDNIYILEGKKHKIIKFDSDGHYLSTITIPFKEHASFLCLAVESSGNVFLGYNVQAPMDLTSQYGIVQLKQTAIYEQEGQYVSIMLDSRLPGCRWHRVELAADIPANTSVNLAYYASDKNPDPPVIEPFGAAIVNPSDALLVEAKGQYLRIQLHLKSNETHSQAPLIKAMKVHFPRDSYLRYLPAIFQGGIGSDDENSPQYKETVASRAFLEKFLSLFETLMSGTEREILRATRYFDAMGTPDQFIPWLSSWLAIAYDENWPLDKKRELLREAPKLYKMRGTRKILEQLIKIYLDIEPIIVERFQLRCEEDEYLESMWDQLLGCGSYGFCVLVPPWQGWQRPTPSDTGNCDIKENLDPMPQLRQVTEPEVRTLRRIIDTEKPAHTSGGLQVMQPFFYLDMHTYLGINTALTKPQWVTDSSSIIGRDTVLEGNEESAQIERNSRIGLDFKLT